MLWASAGRETEVVRQRYLENQAFRPKPCTCFQLEWHERRKLEASPVFTAVSQRLTPPGRAEA